MRAKKGQHAPSLDTLPKLRTFICQVSQNLNSFHQEHNFATILNRLSVLKLFPLLNEIFFPSMPTTSTNSNSEVMVFALSKDVFPTLERATLFKRSYYLNSRTNSHRTFDHHRCLKCKSRQKKVKLSNYFGKNLWCTFTQMLNEKKYKLGRSPTSFYLNSEPYSLLSKLSNALSKSK